MAVGLLAASVAAAADGSPRRRIERLLIKETPGHCEIAGERRPAMACAIPELVALHKGRRVPSSGEIEAPIRQGEIRRGAYVLYSELYTYGALPEGRLQRLFLKAVPHMPRSGARAEAVPILPDVMTDPALRPIAQAPVVVSGEMPASLTLRVPTSEAGRRALYVVRAWPLGPREVRLPVIETGAGRELLIGFGVQDGAAQDAAPAVTFEVVADGVESGTSRTLWRKTLDPGRLPGDRGWQEATLDLEPHWGEKLSLRLVASGGPGPYAAGLATWAQPRLRVTDEGPVRPNVLILSLDTLRADHVGSYGWKRATTPNLDRLAERGVLFEHAIAPFSSTTASHMTMLTSTDPCAHRVTLPSERLSPSIVTLAESLGAVGYDTVAITEDALIKGQAGFERGFDSYRDQRPAVEPLGVFTQGMAFAEEWLARRDEATPFFLFLHTYQVHAPYKVPPRFAHLYPVAGTAPEAKRQEAEYDRGLTYADELVGELLRGLGDVGVLDDTLLIVTSDHGEEFGERGGLGHARGVHVEQVHVPFIVVHPTLATGGRRVSTLVGLVDLAPTVLAVVGASRPDTFQGRSLVPLLRGDTLPPRPLHAEQLWGARQTLRRGARYRWIVTDAGTAVYDGRDDPFESRDLATERPELAKRGAAAVAEYRKACATFQRRMQPATGKSNVIDPAREQALRALGYLD